MKFVVLLIATLVVARKRDKTYPNLFPRWHLRSGLAEREQRPMEEQLDWLCNGMYCHFNNRYNCIANCAEYAKVADIATVNMEDMIIQLALYNATENEAGCEKECNEYIVDGSATALCTPLCKSHFSFPERVRWENEFILYFRREYWRKKLNITN
ncbi:hypothetical protein PFISCL1PPCAC_11126 [Pristionchus fissidentatus]|uniref:Uncharacterized protein n=1 Tax=Pristionchus fissidentatus TaxID=1538716 RepID=A0AAV5VN54_9BILA|nr:hypothetical protein PFISCL1PPCAC_11126 [Pristionchus fissidentatus]